jgi:hypothetical protein
MKYSIFQEPRPNFRDLGLLSFITFFFLFHNTLFCMSTLLFFFLFFSVLKAINQDSSTVPTLLTDYILKGIHSSIYNEV